jgi:GntR family transcriptional regulator / MocR family aminotransferase
MFPWRTTIKIDKQSAKPVYLQVANSIIQEITVGRLLPGQKIPGIKTLGELLQLNRKTIAAAFYELQTQGWIESFEHRGSFVSAKLPEISYKKLPANKLTGAQKNSPGVNDLLSLESLHLDHGTKILIDDGVPDIRLAPLKTLFQLQRSIATTKAFNRLLKYNHVEGDWDLRTTLASHLLATRGIATSPESIFLTRGSQMGIYLVIASLLKQGEVCVTAFPGYRIVDSIISHLGGKTQHIPVDEEGIVTKELEKICKRTKIKLVYTTPHHHYPTTAMMSPARRIELLQLALKYNFFILEDDYDYDFQYENSPVLPLASLDKSGHVIYIGSFSKCLAPSIRIGYFVAPPTIMEAANKLRRIIDRQGDPLLERAMSEFIKSGDLQRHLKKAVRTYMSRRDHFCKLLHEQLSKYLHFEIPQGGMSVWVVFKKAYNINKVSAQLYEKGYRIDSPFAKKLNAIRIGFASMSEPEMKTFIETLKKVLSS